MNSAPFRSNVPSDMNHNFQSLQNQQNSAKSQVVILELDQLIIATPKSDISVEEGFDSQGG